MDKFDEGTRIREYRWMAFRHGFSQVMGWYREKDMSRDIISMGGEWDIFKKIRHKVCRKKVVLDYEDNF